MQTTINTIKEVIDNEEKILECLLHGQQELIDNLTGNNGRIKEVKYKIRALQNELMSIYNLQKIESYSGELKSDNNSKYQKNSPSAIMTSEGRAKDINIGSQNVQKG